MSNSLNFIDVVLLECFLLYYRHWFALCIRMQRTKCSYLRFVDIFCTRWPAELLSDWTGNGSTASLDDALLSVLAGTTSVRARRESSCVKSSLLLITCIDLASCTGARCSMSSHVSSRSVPRSRVTSSHVALLVKRWLI